MQKRRQTIRQTKKWYVLIHLEPELIERHLQWENEERRQKGLRLFEYFIPYQFLPKAVPDQYAKDAESQNRYADDTNDLRKTLRQFVFIKASSNEVSRLVHQPWNREGRLHLHFYVSRNGHRITMPDPMMESFVTLCCENRQRFTFGPPIENVDEFDTVVIATGVFKDTEARILDVQDTSHGISITLGIPFFNGEKMLTLPDFKLSDVHLPHTVESLLNEHFISNVETTLVDILDRRVKRPKDTDRFHDDVAALNHIFHYSYVKMPDRPSYCRFRALMLICAALRIDMDSRRALTAEVEQMVAGLSEATSEEHAYLMAALYIATGNATYRTMAKQYQQQHADTALSLNRIMSPVKRMNRQFFKSITPRA